jgi:hypothetical protein
MKLITIVALIMIAATPGLASSGQETMGTGLMALLFLGFGSLIVVCQLIPGVMLFCSMLKGLFNGAATKSAPRTDAKTS